ncbi:MAG: transcription elongation factor [Proteobacteria bacterium]|nr:transcription elongation factor [Pseudomonadota bacterium]
MSEANLILSRKDYLDLMVLQLSADLRTELEQAIVVPVESIEPDVVTIGARVKYYDHKTNSHREIEIVLPEDVDSAYGRVSVLAPVGAALIGLKEGQVIDWDFPDGSMRRLTVISVIQPEAVRLSQ